MPSTDFSRTLPATPPSDTPILHAQAWRFAYPGRLLLRDWSACIRPGVSLVLGGDGAGKTTLLRLLAGALAPQAGSARLLGLPLPPWRSPGAPHVFWVEPRSSGLDAVTPAQWFAQLPALYPRWDGEALALHVRGFDLLPHLHKPMEQLSTGTHRKVLFAAGFACGAELTLFDEPVAGLDRPSIHHLKAALAGCAGQGARALVVAHYEPLPGVPWRDTWVLPD